MDPKKLPDELRARIEDVSAKRPRTVLEHILKHGQITTDELKQLYGYNHPPRAARDVREEGIPLKTVRVPGPDGRKIAAYTLDLDAEVSSGKAGGRRSFSRAFKTTLVEIYGERCCLCGAPFEARALQIDHRVPYEVAGDTDSQDPRDYMLVCGSCNRAKSWSCEQCRNWRITKDAEICATCMWASPEKYEHIALQERRSVTVTWVGDEVREFDLALAGAESEGIDVSEVLKDALARWRTNSGGQ
jgi:hypothetical protein